MKLILRQRSGKFIDNLIVPDDLTVNDFKQLFYSKFHYYPERQRWTHDSAGSKVLIDGTLSEHGVIDGSTVYFKDLGVQISWRLVFVLEYFGPIFILPLFYYFPNMVYGAQVTSRCLVQKVALFLAIVHYVKRELETLFVHRFSNATMPIIRLPINCGHYWILFGTSVGYYLFHPFYKSYWNDDQSLIVYLLAGLMLIFEFLNYKTHLILRNLRKRGTKQRGIPVGWGFDQVSCANYYWETLAWVAFCFLVMSLTAWIFTIVAFLQMSNWALKKHYMYKKDVNYPRGRKAILPLLF